MPARRRLYVQVCARSCAWAARVRIRRAWSLDLKNIARRIEAFVVRLHDTTPLTSQRLLENAAGDNPVALGKPSIAVLAFTNMSGDPEQEYFSDGISDDIITELSRSRSLLVIARNSSFTYRGKSVDLKRVARELGVRYVVDGAVRRSGTRVRVSAQLVEAETSSHMWAERYDRNVEEIFALQDEITIAIVKAIEPVI